MIEVVRKYDFSVYYDDGDRLDILAEDAGVVLICIDDTEAAVRAVELIKAHFPGTPVMVCASDRVHERIRETFESAIILGRKAIEARGAEPDEVEAYNTTRIRERDRERLCLEEEEGQFAGRKLFGGDAATAGIDLAQEYR